MANTYHFEITSVDAHISKDGLENVIYNVHYSYIAEDGNGNKASQFGVVHFPSVDPENFTPFEDLKQADVIAWIESEVPVEQFQQSLDSQISEIVAPKIVNLQIPE